MIVISTVISSDASKTSLKFVSDSNRLCVAMTRAKRQLLVIGHRDTLMRDSQYREIIRSSRSWFGEGAGVRARVELSQESKVGVSRQSLNEDKSSSNRTAKSKDLNDTENVVIEKKHVDGTVEEEEALLLLEQGTDDEDLLMLLDEEEDNI